MDLSRWKKYFKGKNNLLILLLVGLLLIVISIPSGKKETEEETDSAVVEEEDYARKMERKLENILNKTEGTGNVSVMITLKTSEESIVEKDDSSNLSTSTAQSDVQEEKESSETTVYEEGSDGTQTPYVSKTVTPQIDGVIIVADGGDDPVVVENITGAVKALFDVDMHKIKVMKRKSSE